VEGQESDSGALGKSRTTKTTKDLTNAGYSRWLGRASALALAAIVAFFQAPFGAPSPFFLAFVRPSKNPQGRRCRRAPGRVAQRGAPQRSGWPTAILEPDQASVSVPFRGGPGGALCRR
jgi:hypothetical protein